MPSSSARVDAQRMLARGDHPRQQQAAQAHAAHEGAEQDAERDRRRADDQLQQLEPDDLVDQRGAAAADEQTERAQEENGVGFMWNGWRLYRRRTRAKSWPMEDRECHQP